MASKKSDGDDLDKALAALAALNDGADLEEMDIDVNKLHAHANDHPELPLAGNIRSNLAAKAQQSASEDVSN